MNFEVGHGLHLLSNP